MYKKYNVLCIIPAREGSKGLPGKNIKILRGKPLIAHSIAHAKRSGYIDRIIVSTDSRKIAAVSKRYGAEVPFKRPKGLASDRSSVIDVLLHAVDRCEKGGSRSFDIIVLLQATSPLRRPEDIDRCIELLVKKGADNVFSVTESSHNPYYSVVEAGRDGHPKLVKRGGFAARQLAPKVFDMNGAVYVWWKDVLKREKAVFLRKSRIYVMPKARSVDIDDEVDFKFAETLLKG